MNSSNNTLLSINFDQIVELGRFYYPAWKHYNKQNANVTCDRCKRNRLTSCIGYMELDLCLPCADDVSSLISRKYDASYNKTFMEQDIFDTRRNNRWNYTTMMELSMRDTSNQEQDIFSDYEDNYMPFPQKRFITKMKQNMFSK